ncbi:hypothetical protein ACOMHN_006270 [Nucella lapillus]
MAEVDLVFSLDEIMSDFESGLIPAVRHNFPNTRHKGCYFHYSQAIWRRVQQLGLQAVYQEDDRVKTFIRKLMAIAFLPVIAVRPAVTTLGDEPYLVDVPQLQLLLLYYTDTWLNGSFPQSMWNVSDASIRTNNSVESWHSKLNSLIGRTHPNIHTLVSVLRKEQWQTEQIIARARLGFEPPLQKKKYRQLENRLNRVRLQYRAGEMNSNDYITILSHMVHHY